MRRMSRIDFVSRVLLVSVIGAGVLTVWSCENRDPVGEIAVVPSKTLLLGQSATLSIEVSGLGTHVIQWIAQDGKFAKPTDESVTVWVAPNRPGPVVITCQVTSRGKIHQKHLPIDVVERVEANSTGQSTIATQGQREGEQPIRSQKAARNPSPPGEPYDIEEGGFIPSGWMGDGERGTKYVWVNRVSRDTPHSEPFSQMWTYTPDSSSVGWTAVAWQFPENNWGDKNGKDLSNRGFTQVTLWARGLKGGEKIQFKAGGHTNPAKDHQATFGVETDFIQLTTEWQQYTLSLQGEDLSNVASAFAWAMRAEDNPNGATFYLDDIRYE